MFYRNFLLIQSCFILYIGTFSKEVLLHNMMSVFLMSIENIIPQKSSMPRRAAIYI